MLLILPQLQGCPPPSHWLRAGEGTGANSEESERRTVSTFSTERTQPGDEGSAAQPGPPPRPISSRNSRSSRAGGKPTAPASYRYFIPGCLTLDSLEEGAFCTESCPRLRATMATARNLPRVPKIGRAHV